MNETIEKRTKIILEGEREYVESIQRIKNAYKGLRDEIEQLNLALEKEAKLLGGYDDISSIDSLQ